MRVELQRDMYSSTPIVTPYIRQYLRVLLSPIWSAMMTCLKCMSFLLLLALGLARPSAGVKEVFVVPHSHCDAGWLLTAQQYFEKWPVGAQLMGCAV